MMYTDITIVTTTQMTWTPVSHVALSPGKMTVDSAGQRILKRINVTMDTKISWRFMSMRSVFLSFCVETSDPCSANHILCEFFDRYN